MAVVVLIVVALLAGCRDPDVVTSPGPTGTVGRSPVPGVSTTGTASTDVNATITVVLQLPGDWSRAIIEAGTEDFSDAELHWETTSTELATTLPGAGEYVFWAETPSSENGLCFYQAQSHPNGRRSQFAMGTRSYSASPARCASELALAGFDH